MKRCPKCGTTFPDEANFCPKDAGRLVPDSGGNASPGSDDSLYGGRFRLGERLGGGVTGEIYEADDTETGQKVALKIVDPAVFPTPLLLQRTERELKQLERLDAAGLARVFAHGRDAGKLWVASELLSGGALDQLVAAQGPLSLDRATEIVLAIGRALGESAKAGVIHRDLSPKNVIVDGGQVKLINFGIPTPESAGVQGVPEYVSPEQVDGKPVDQRSNIYSLGAIYYFLLTGEPPFSGDPQQVLEHHRSTPPEPPSTRGDHGIPPSVDAVVLKALEKSSSKRFMTLRQLLEQVERSASGDDPSGTQPMGRAGGTVTRKQPAATIMGGYGTGNGAGNGRPTAPMAAPEQEAARHAAAQVEQAAGVAQPAAAQNLAAAPAVAHQPPAAANVAAPDPARPAVAVDAATVPAQVVEAATEPAQAIQEPARPQVAQPSSSAGKGKGRRRSSSSGSRKGQFRETMWFKKGALDEEASAKSNHDDMPSEKADEMPIEDRYADDGTLSARDQQAFSLRTGHTQAMQVPRHDGATPAVKSNVSEDELIGEMKTGRGKLIAAIALAVVLLAGIIVFFATR